jgi:hypothetical protein
MNNTTKNLALLAETMKFRPKSKIFILQSKMKKPPQYTAQRHDLESRKKIPTLVTVGTRVGRGRRFLASG